MRNDLAMTESVTFGSQASKARPDPLAPAGPRDRAGGVVGEGPRADDRRVTDPTVQLVGQPAGRTVQT